MRKRRNGEGSIFFDENRNKYVASMYDPNGKRITKRFNTEQEEKDWMTVKKADFVNETYVPPSSITLGEWLKRFLEYSKRPHLKQSSFAKYVYCANFLKPIYKQQLQSLTPAGIQKFYSTLEHLSPSMRKQIHILLSAAIREAVLNGILKKNFMETIKSPKVVRPDIKVFTKEELNKLYLTCKEHSRKWETIFLLAATTGMRRGEIMGLLIENVFDDHVYVNNILQEVNGERIQTSPKTKSSIRYVSINETVRSLLKDVIGNRTQGLVFLSERGTPHFASNWELSWRKLVKKSGVEYRNFHSIRHTYASTLIAEGVPIASVSKALGHSSVMTTVSIYLHPVYEGDTKVIEKSNELFNFDKVATTLDTEN